MTGELRRDRRSTREITVDNPGSRIGHGRNVERDDPRPSHGYDGRVSPARQPDAELRHQLLICDICARVPSGVTRLSQNGPSMSQKRPTAQGINAHP
jgi:hypothetical protein